MELTANELRIGNLVNTYKDDVHYGIEIISNVSNAGINESLTGEYSAVFKYPMNDDLIIKPIPLTEEWALKLGGKELPNGCVQFERFFIIPYDKGNNKWAVSHNGTNAHVTELHTVHELQNFFHCVGEELTTK
jgi:hypothetical protein